MSGRRAPIEPATTFCNPLDLDYRFALDTPSRRDVSDPVITSLDDAYYLFASNNGGYWYSRDLRDWQLVEPRGLPANDGAKRVFVRDGRLYYAVPESKTLYTTDDARSGTWREVAAGSMAPIDSVAFSPDSMAGPFASKRGGFTASVGASSAFVDRAGNRWRVMTLAFGPGGRNERRLGIFPAARDSAGVERVDTYLGDHPQLVPGVITDPVSHDATGWMLLSWGKLASASSVLAGHAPALAFDEDGSSWWSAATGGVGEWLAVDLGAIARVAAIQVNFAEQGAHALGRDEDDYQQYLIESSLDGVRWTTRIDESRTRALHRTGTSSSTPRATQGFSASRTSTPPLAARSRSATCGSSVTLRSPRRPSRAESSCSVPETDGARD